MRRRWRLVPLLALPALLIFALDRAFPPVLSRLHDTGTEITDRTGRTLALLPAPGGVWRLGADPATVAPVLTDLLVRVEDRRFWLHPGIDPVALARACVQWLRAGHVVSGGSTLSMQAARLLEPRPRTIRSKLIEMARAVQLEARYGKPGVLRIWLTLAPLGGNLEGVQAGARAWFGTSAQALDPAQAALLVAIPRRPETLRPDRHPDRARLVRDRVLAAGAGLFAVADWQGAAMPTIRVPMPRHAAQAVAALPRSGGVVATTLDLPLQVAVERLGADALRDLPPRGSVALLVAQAGSREIRALYAGAWGQDARAGAMDLTRAVRSPGSAMKPFIYAMAFADGIAAPDSVLADLPRRFGGYAPENFDRGFSGAVTAAEALQRSLNLPAVGLLDRIGPLRFAQTLQAAGVALHLPEGADAALPLALGGAGVTLRQAVAMYAALATDGRAAPLRLTPEAGTAPVSFLPGAAAASVATVLTRPFLITGAPGGGPMGGGPAGVAWKTGTSWGGRDAWALGFDAEHVAGVWVGRPDGTPLPGATGAALALPLLARLFALLPASPRTAPAVPSSAPVAAPHAATDALHLLFPPSGAVLSADGPVVIRAMGGRRPLAFLVDGAPIEAEPARREAAWVPPGAGFYQVTVIDAEGAAVHGAVQVK